MGVFKNGVGRPSNETIKKRNIFKMICIILALIIIIMVVYILNDKGIINFGSKDNKVVTNNKYVNEETQKEEILDVNSDLVVNLFDKMNKFTNGLDLLDLDSNSFDNFYTYFYQNDNLKQEQVDDKIKFAYSFINLYKDVESVHMVSMYDWEEAKKLRKSFVGSVSDVNNESIKLFGSGFDINNVLINGVGPAILSEKTIINNDKITIECAEIGDAGSADIFTKIISGKKENNKIIIENKVMFVAQFPRGDYMGTFIYKTAKKFSEEAESAAYGLSDKIAEFHEDNILDKIKIDDYLDKLDTFKWTFKEDGKGNYTFESVEKVK